MGVWQKEFVMCRKARRVRRPSAYLASGRETTVRPEFSVLTIESEPLVVLTARLPSADIVREFISRLVGPRGKGMNGRMSVRKGRKSSRAVLRPCPSISGNGNGSGNGDVKKDVDLVPVRRDLKADVARIRAEMTKKAVVVG